MNEKFLYYIWQFKRWETSSLLLTQKGETVEVISPGYRNQDAGPDFLEAKIKINDILWIGNVEIHVNTSDWFLHGHDNNPAYQNLILHVVYNHNLNEVPNDIPILELNQKIPKTLLLNYDSLQPVYQFIPCENFFQNIDDFTLKSYLESLVIQKFQTKTDELTIRLDQLNGDLEALAYEQTAYAFGLKINAHSFQVLTKALPYSILKKHIQNTTELEALLYGQGCFLQNLSNENKEEYPLELTKIYNFLQHKYQLTPIHQHLFKFFRLRPSNFPTIRLSQFANLLSNQKNLFHLLTSSQNSKSIFQILSQIKASSYWDNHFTFLKESNKNYTKKLTHSFIESLFINAIIPLKLVYNVKLGKDNSIEILKWLQLLSPEKNTIIQSFEELGVHIENAWESQALLELKKTFCDEKNCLNCRIGNKILNLKH